MPNNLQMSFQTVTPIWTGSVDEVMDRVRETGLIGNLRWWYELMLRGLGGVVNDPTGSQRSQFNKQLYEQSQATEIPDRYRQAGLCDASYLFGATGWRRQFRLTVTDQTKPYDIPYRIKADRTGNEGWWYFKNPPRVGPFSITLQSLRPDFDVNVMGGLLQFLTNRAALGARNQLGFGVVRSRSTETVNSTALYNHLCQYTGNVQYPALPSFKNLFLTAIQLPTPDQTNIQHTFNLKYDLRELFRKDKTVRHFIMGTVHGRSRMGAKIKISWPDENGVIRVWGWIPEQIGANSPYPRGWDRNRIMQAIHTHITGKYQCLYWNEFNSPRDTEMANEQDTNIFLQYLLNLEGGA